MTWLNKSPYSASSYLTHRNNIGTGLTRADGCRSFKWRIDPERDANDISSVFVIRQTGSSCTVSLRIHTSCTQLTVCWASYSSWQHRLKEKLTLTHFGLNFDKLSLRISSKSSLPFLATFEEPWVYGVHKVYRRRLLKHAIALENRRRKFFFL